MATAVGANTTGTHITEKPGQRDTYTLKRVCASVQHNTCSCPTLLKTTPLTAVNIAKIRVQVQKYKENNKHELKFPTHSSSLFTNVE